MKSFDIYRGHVITELRCASEGKRCATINFSRIGFSLDPTYLTEKPFICSTKEIFDGIFE